MSAKELNKFRGLGPLEFLKTHAVNPCDNHNLIASIMKDHQGDHWELNAEKRIAAFDLSKDRRHLGATEGAYSIETKPLSQISNDKLGDYETCYYLPWNADGGITEIALTPAASASVAMTRGRSNAATLPPPRGGPKLVVGGHRGAVPPSRAAPTPNNAFGLDPDLFFTTQLSGCSIFITGPATGPTVFHAGKGATVAANPTKYWQDLFQTVMAKKGPLGNYVEVNKNDYNYRAILKPGTVDESAKMNRNMTEYAQILIDDERRFRRPFFIHLVSGWGNVFGIRDKATREWAFYRQEVVHIIYGRTKGGKMSDPDIKSISKVAALTKVFPDTKTIVTPKSHIKMLKP